MREVRKTPLELAAKPSRPSEPNPDAASEPSREPASRDGFHATIENAGLWDLVQLICGSRIRTTACIRSGMRTGYLYFADGQVMHAAVGSMEGEAAALEILSWRQGTWQSSDVPWPAGVGIGTPWQGLLLRAAQLEDEGGGRAAEPELRPDGYRPGDFEHAVRIDHHGAVMAGHGRPHELAALAAYVCQVGDLIGALLGMDKLIAVDGALAQGVTCLIFRKRGGETIALRPRDGVDLSLLRAQWQL